MAVGMDTLAVTKMLDILEKEFRQLPEPVIVGPKQPIPVERIIRYTLDGHEELYRMGYDDAKRAWREAGKAVEGESLE